MGFMRLGQCDHGRCRMKELGMSGMSSSCQLKRRRRIWLDVFLLGHHLRRRGWIDMFINRIQSNRMIISICIEYDIL